MDQIIIALETQSETRASEIPADLRNVAETLFYPMKLVGLWTNNPEMHMCPQEERNQSCPHNLPLESAEHISYSETLQREKQANLEVIFPHAETKIYLS